MFKFNYVLKQSELDLPNYFNWEKRAVSEIVKTLQEETFPCVFAQRANDLRNLLFVFVSTDNSKEYNSDYALDDLLKGLIEYTEFCKKIPTRERLYFPLIIIFNWQLDNLKDSQNKAWEVLNQVYQYNLACFDKDIVIQNIDAKDWKFRFNGVNLFLI